MELLAPIGALKAINTGRAPVHANAFSKIVICTDSRYVTENIYAARFTWPSEGWATREGNPVANAELWKSCCARRAGRTDDPSSSSGQGAREGPAQQGG
jgi:ribonuclease HI